jgi:hypothetical protein
MGPFERSNNSDCYSLEMTATQYVAQKSRQGAILQALVLNVTNIGKYESIFSVGHLEYPD